MSTIQKKNSATDVSVLTRARTTKDTGNTCRELQAAIQLATWHGMWKHAYTGSTHLT